MVRTPPQFRQRGRNSLLLVWTAMTYANPADARPQDDRPAAADATAEITVEYHEATPMAVPLDVTSRVVGLGYRCRPVSARRAR